MSSNIFKYMKFNIDDLMDLTKGSKSRNGKQKVECNKHRREQYNKETSAEQSQRKTLRRQQRTKQKISIDQCEQVNNGTLLTCSF